MRYGYARVSSKTQDYSAQVDTLKTAGCERIFSEKRSGKSVTDRPEFNKLMRTLVPGDIIVVSKLDRLARSCITFCMRFRSKTVALSHSVTPGATPPPKLAG